MSLFLGKIHYWLYNKITWAEKMEKDIIVWAKSKDITADELFKDAVAKYGEPTGGKALEDIIDTGNIHGWLQARIESVECRQADIITKILGANPSYKEEIVGLFSNQGKAAASEYEAELDTPEEAFNALNDFIVEGMPCDRVNEMMESSDDKFVWRTTACLHKQYWDKVDGDVNVFYELRDTWVKAFIEGLGFGYTKSEGSVHEITKK